MPISWNDIRSKALRFAREWADETREAGEYQTFWNEFFDMFGVRRRTIARYQERVNLLAGGRGFIDLFWPGTLIAEHKTAGHDLASAYEQAGSYFDALPEDDRPRYIIVTDYRRVRLYDLEAEGKIEKIEFELRDLPKHINRFGFIAGWQPRTYKEENPINIKAVKAVARLADALAKNNYPRDNIPKLLVRLVFCFFADDSGIFPKDAFWRYIQFSTREDGGDFGRALGEIFQILNVPTERRQTTLDEDLASLPYVNGGLFAWNFEEGAPFFIPSFSREMRQAVLDATKFDWSGVSPAIFGSMFQAIMDEKSRHDLGAHYTSEKNILKIVEPLFLDDLKAELAEAVESPAKLNTLRQKLASLKLLDPACGCGNFLVVSYRELRRLEHEIIRRLYRKEIERKQENFLSSGEFSKLHVSQMNGIELEDFPVEIAQLSLWLTDHQMNSELSEIIGQFQSRIPLTDSPHIVQGNALALDWETIVPKAALSYILGNPPFVSKQDRSREQKEEMKLVFGALKGEGELDYVTAWYLKAAEYIQGANIGVAFVSTNSIVQGEQAGVLWPELFRRGIKINFAHRTFKWTNEAPGRAAVFCVIVGFGLSLPKRRRLFEYDNPAGEPHEITAENINPYLVDADDVVITARRAPFSDVPLAVFGNMPNDAGQFLFDDEKEKDEFLVKEPKAAKFIRPLLSAKEYLQGGQRYCLWLKGASPDEINALPEVRRRVENVREYRKMSQRAATRALAATPFLFGEDRQPDLNYILIPRVSSERRQYVPLGFFGSEYIVGDTCIAIPGATFYHLGILQSEMHMAWMRAVCGRLKSDYRYSNELVYNNFPWPENPPEEKRRAVEITVERVLGARSGFPNATLADLYDPNTMPKVLLDAHRALDRSADACYSVRTFATEMKRLEFLFGLYQHLAMGTDRKLGASKKKRAVPIQKAHPK